MKPDSRFLSKPLSFWAAVRSLSQEIGYSKKGVIIAPDAGRIVAAFKELNLNTNALEEGGKPTAFARELEAYFLARQDALHNIVEPNLMSADEARTEFEKLKEELSPTCPLPMNKQKGEKKTEAYLTGIVNMVIEKNLGNLECNYDPRELATFTRNNLPIRTSARRVDGAFPSPVNPVALWEIKEYYYTKTFGSRVAGGVYETLLDGMEIQELKDNEGIDVMHYLIVDAHDTWWEKGKPYLCRMYDMLHMGLVSEILFGREAITELPRIVQEWRKAVDPAP